MGDTSQGPHSFLSLIKKSGPEPFTLLRINSAKGLNLVVILIMPWHTYIIQCRDNVLYTGITNDLSRRIRDHNSGNGCRYTKYRWPVKLIHSEEFLSKSEALKREAYIKGLTREKKLCIAKTLRPSGSVFNSTK